MCIKSSLELSRRQVSEYSVSAYAHFCQGKERVGTAAELPLVRRVQLAVVAHIRHIYTDYDKLLKKGDYHVARAQVEQPTLDKLLTWRRDDDDDANAMEGILREVIVIPDDDEEDENHDLDFAEGARPNREDSVEIVSNHAIIDEVQMKPIEYGMLDIYANQNRSCSPDMNTGGIVRYVRRERLPYEQQVHHGQGIADRLGDYRNRVWEEALHRRRKDPGPFYPIEHHPVVPKVASSSQHVVAHNHADPRSQWPEVTARKPHLIEYVGKAPAREQLRYHALPPNDKPVVFSHITDHSRERPRELVDTPGQVSEIYPLTICVKQLSLHLRPGAQN